MKFPQIEKAIENAELRNTGYYTTLRRGAELALSALGEEPPTLTEEQMRSVQAAYKGGNRIECLNSAIAEAFRLVFRSEPEIPPGLAPFLYEDYSAHSTIHPETANRAITAAFNAGVELGKRGGK